MTSRIRPLIVALVLLLPTQVFGQATVVPVPRLQFFTNAGAPCNTCTLSTYLANSSTAQTLYTDSSLSTQAGTPITMNSAGRPQVSGTEVNLYQPAFNMKFVLATSGGTTIWTADNVRPTASGLVLPSTFAVGDILYADTTASLARLADVATGSVLVSGGLNTAPAWSANPTVTTLTATGDISFGGGDLIATANGLIRRNTADASDSGTIEVNGGGATGSSRGGGVTFNGNEASAAGDIVAQVGNVSGSEFSINRADGTESFQLLGTTGATTVTSSATDSGFVLDSSTTSGSITVNESAAVRLTIGFGLSTATGNAGIVEAPAGDLHLNGADGDIFSNLAETTATAANMVFESSQFKTSTSSARYKRDLLFPVTGQEWRWILRLQTPVSYTHVSNGNRRFGGLIAEDVAAKAPDDGIGGKMFIHYNAEGQPEDVMYPHLVAPVIAGVQNHEDRLAKQLDIIQGLLTRIAELEARVKALEP